MLGAEQVEYSPQGEGVAGQIWLVKSGWSNPAGQIPGDLIRKRLSECERMQAPLTTPSWLQVWEKSQYKLDALLAIVTVPLWHVFSNPVGGRRTVEGAYPARALPEEVSDGDAKTQFKNAGRGIGI